jgi:hypothetical protein
VNPDEVMLRNARSGKDITPVWDAMTRPLTPEEQAAFGKRDDGPRIPDPRPFVRLNDLGDEVAVEVGVEGTF